MSDLDATIADVEGRRESILETLKDFTRIPSISAGDEHAGEVKRSADWAAGQLEALDCDPVEIHATPGHPIVYGSWLKAGPMAPTILVYGHTDVQPADPLDEWHSPPFEPDVRGENFYARGAADMKAQIVALLSAVEALQRNGQLAVNLKFLMEGEEEIGSPNLAPFIRQHRDLLACDICLNLDAGLLAADLPSMIVGLRGLAYFEIRLQGAAADLHSGKFGGALDNPGLVLSELIAGMRDEHGEVTLPGFYEPVRPLTETERREMAHLPQNDDWWLGQSGARALPANRLFTATERATARPSLDVNGLLTGFTGKGAKTVLPGRAMAKISMRLVPDQSAEQVKRSLIAYLEAHCPDTVSWELVELSSADPAMIDRSSPALKAASLALEQVWGRPPVFYRDGATVPVVSMMQEILKVESLMLGFSLPDDNPHAPNEKQHLPTFFRGIETYIRFLHGYA